MFLNKKSERGIRNLQSVAKINGRSKESEKLDVKVSRRRLAFAASSSSGATRESLYLQMVQESMKKELVGSQDSYSFMDLFRTPTMRLTTISLSAVWYDAARSANKNVRVTRGLALQVLHQLRLLRPVHGPAEVRGGHLPNPGDLRSG